MKTNTAAIVPIRATEAPRGERRPGATRAIRTVAAAAIACLAAWPAAALGNFGFERKIDARFFPDDARQWKGYAQSILLTDLTRVAPASAVATDKRHKGQWRALEYETAAMKGVALSAYERTKPAAVSLEVGATGWHAVYVGLGTVSDGDSARSNGMRAKLGSGRVYRRLANNVGLVEPENLDALGAEDFPRDWKSRDVIQELFLTVANLGPGETVDFAPIHNHAANLMYVRLVPLSTDERNAWQREETQKTTRRSAATIDGESWIISYDPQNADELREEFEGHARTDFSQWWFCVLGADITCYPTKVGTIEGEGAEDYPEQIYADFNRAVTRLGKAGVNPLVVASEAARKLEREFHVFIRPQAWAASMPWEEVFNSKFYRAHPEWRTVDREGREAMYLSYAVPEVQQQTLAVLREAIELSNADGVGLYFNRGVPLMLWEKPFADRFRRKHGVDVMSVAAEDRRVFEMRADIMTEYLRSIRGMLDEMSRVRAGKRYAITAVTLPDQSANERYGLDIARWAREGLVDQFGIAPDKHISYEQAAPADLEYYRRAVGGTPVKIFPCDAFTWRSRVPVWSSGKPEDLCRLVLQQYERGADGIAVWDPSPGKGWPGNARYDGNAFDLQALFGHRELLAHWAQNGVPKPNTFPLRKLGGNEYSKYRANTGY